SSVATEQSEDAPDVERGDSSEFECDGAA
ncbi:MAG: hypothetical protein K0S92_462, partial [Desertimonas sp.]|nr:hypothetical protein [Desertimonas sp.]